MDKNILDLGRNALVLILGRLLDGDRDWKKLAIEKGQEILRDEVYDLAQKFAKNRAARIAVAMAHDGWSWEKAADRDFLVSQKVEVGQTLEDAGFYLSRDALYHFFKELHVPGGPLRDAWRDAVDNGVWALVQKRVTPGETGLTELVEITGEELANLIL